MLPVHPSPRTFPSLALFVGLSAVVHQSVSAAMAMKTPPPQPTTALERPALVEDALANNVPLYYFGIGSNMLKSKLENRSSKGKIELMSIEPALVRNHRLAFNMRGFFPLEPAMGAIEPTDYDATPHDTPSKPLYSYDKPECHGALVQLTPENYEKVMESEGISKGNVNRGYDEIVVTAIPYDASKPPVQAIALRARPHVRLSKDPAPSPRYMTILREGAAELGLSQCYQDYLAQHPVHRTPQWLKHMALQNLIFTFTLNALIGGPRNWIGRAQAWLLYHSYVPPTSHAVLRVWYDCVTALVLFPGSLGGMGVRAYRHITKTEHPPFMKRILGLVHEPTSPSSTATASSSPSAPAAAGRVAA